VTQFHLQQIVATVVVQIAFWTSLAVPFVMLTYWPWNRERFPQLMIALDILISVALLPAIMRYYFGFNSRDLWFGWFDVFIVMLIPVRTTWMAYAIFKLQKAGVLARRSPPHLPHIPEHPEPAEPANPANNE
jgi:hypothetical protein